MQVNGRAPICTEPVEARRRVDPEVWSDAPTVDRRAVHERVAALAAELFQAV
jgi:hypothetical protein